MDAIKCGPVFAQGIRVFISLWIAGLVFSSVSLSAERNSVHLDRVSIHLFLENKGTFSEDVTSMYGFFARNAQPFGIGFADDDRFHSFLIKVWFSSERKTFQADEQARVAVKSEKTAKTLFSTTINGVYVGSEGRAIKSFLVSGQVCEPLVVKVRSRTRSISKTLPFNCGE
jgi:hypothetical protein